MNFGLKIRNVDDYSFRKDSPLSSMRWSEAVNLSKMASAMVGSLI